MKYLVLGANSFYGGAFHDLLLEKGERFDLVYGPRFRLDEPEKSQSLESGIDNCDCIVNFMSKALVPESWEDPALWMKINAWGMTHLLEILRRHEPKPFIHVSTPEVYGSSTNWVGEKTCFRPSTPYAVSRAAADMMLKAYWKAYKFPMMITRTANIYGPGQQAFRLIPKAFRLIRAGDKFPVHGKGNSQRSFIHVRDACEALLLLSKEGEFGETYHISTQKTHSIIEVVKLIAHQLGRNHEDCYEFIPDRLGKDHAYLLNSDKMRELGWTDTITLKEGLKDYENSTVEHQGS